MRKKDIRYYIINLEEETCVFRVKVRFRKEV